MKIYHWNNLKDISVINNSISKDEIILCSTDTVLGLLGRISQKSCDKLNTIKLRQDKPYIILVSSIEKADYFSPSFQSAQLRKFAQRCWPGPVTLIVKANTTLPDYVRAADNSVAIRIPNHHGLLTLLRQFDGLFSTSANKAGMSVPKKIDEVDSGILNAVAHVVIDEENQMQTIPSTILDCTQDDQIRVVREGAYSIAKLEKLYGCLFK